MHVDLSATLHLPSLVAIDPVILGHFVNVFLRVYKYLPLEMGMSLHLNKREFPLPLDALCLAWITLNYSKSGKRCN